MHPEELKKTIDKKSTEISLKSKHNERTRKNQREMSHWAYHPLTLKIDKRTIPMKYFQKPQKPEINGIEIPSFKKLLERSLNNYFEKEDKGEK